MSLWDPALCRKLTRYCQVYRGQGRAGGQLRLVRSWLDQPDKSYGAVVAVASRSRARRLLGMKSTPEVAPAIYASATN
jgi:hypothetical protein